MELERKVVLGPIDSAEQVSQRFLVVRQRAGPLVKALVTDNLSYLRRYGPESLRSRCGPALSRTSLDKLELRLALFGFDGIFYTLTFDEAHLPNSLAASMRAWGAFLQRLKRWKKTPVDFYVYRIEGQHGDKRWHIHCFLRDTDFPPAVVRHLWTWGSVNDVPYDRRRILRDHGYRGLAIYFCKERPEVGRHPWGCARALRRHLPQPEISRSRSGMIRLPPGSVPLPMGSRERPQLGDWGVFGYARYLLPD